MHPILTSGRRLSLYVAAWIPLAALLVYVTWAAGGVSWRDAAATLAPACLVYAFVCLSPWYICRTQPLEFSRVPGLLTTFGAAAVAGGLMMAAAARVAESLLGRPAGRPALLFGMGVLLYLFSAVLHYAALAVATSRDAERRAAEARTMAREAELQALRMHLNPHFLFNSLHSIAALATLDGARAREMCVRLAGFLRESLGLGARESIPLREELGLARSYLQVEQVRFGERLRVEEQIEPACEECAVPALLLQPLVENAVKHGIAGLVEGGLIRLAAQRRGAAVSITLENAFDPETTPASGSGNNLGLGLTHVRRRLEVRYGEEARFDARAEGAVYRVVLRLPCESPMASSSRA
ncbi:MAG: histidine kinase [Acidobacteriia bacterium]|nr:histidine kinase [Terriglobia bacterium]